MTFNPTHQYRTPLQKVEIDMRLTVDDVDYVVFKEADGEIDISTAEAFNRSLTPAGGTKYQYVPRLLQIEEIVRGINGGVEHVIYRDLDGDVSIVPAAWFDANAEAIAK